MLENLIGNIAARFIGKWLDGKKTLIGAVVTVIGFLPVVVGKIWPELNLPVDTTQDWSTVIEGITKACRDIGPLIATGGVLHKAYKAGLITPCPESLNQQKPNAPEQTGEIQQSEKEGMKPGAPGSGSPFGTK